MNVVLLQTISGDGEVLTNNFKVIVCSLLGLS
jgi:hypothetical protein